MSQSDVNITLSTGSTSQPAKAQRPILADFVIAEPGYERLVAVFKAAHDQAALGKGKERHANDLPFEDQRMLSICRLQGSPNGMSYQVIKKLTEGLAMPEYHRKFAELYGAINYLAGIVIFLEDQQGEPLPPLTPDEMATAEMLKQARCAHSNPVPVDASKPDGDKICPDCEQTVHKITNLGQ